MKTTAAEWHRAFLDEEREKLALEAEAEKRDKVIRKIVGLVGDIMDALKELDV